ncbi:MAG: hypothetical protein ACXAC2_05605 [Candidatus Kariarchaeaceae archaeon]|jgi:hypothetical protein
MNWHLVVMIAVGAIILFAVVYWIVFVVIREGGWWDDSWLK